MIHPAVLLVTVALSPPQPARYATDTTVRVERGSRLRVQTMGGDIVVRTWERDELRVQAEHSRRTDIVVRRSGSVVDVSARGNLGFSGVVDYQITAPTWMALELGGMNAEVSIDGTRASVRVETLQGDIRLRGGDERVSLSTTNGRVEVSEARGRIDLRAMSSDVIATDIQGDIAAESVSGSVELRNVVARSVEAQTVSGDLVLTGQIADGGTYSLFTHSGDITLGIPERANALITLSSATGDFDVELDLRAERTTRRRQTFRLGTGSATVELETFSGDIHIVRQSDVPGRRRGRDDEPDDRNRRRPRRPPADNDDPPSGEERWR